MSDYTFNTPPNWPQPPAGWKPPTGWQPDPSWGAVPEGWQLWLPTTPATPTPPTAPQQPVYQAPQYAPQPVPVTPQQPAYQPQQASPPAYQQAPPLPLYNQQPQFGVPQQFPPRKKSYAGAIVAVIATVVIGALIAGGLYLFNVVLVVPDFDGEQTFESASTAEEAHQILQEEYDKMDAYIDTIEGGILYESYHDNLDFTLEGGLASETIWEIEGYTQAVIDTKASIDEEVAAWEAVYSVDEANLTNDTGTIQEEIIDRISGGLVEVSVDNACEATACVKLDDPTRVHIISEYVDRTDIIWEDVMRHEYAHVIQNKYEYNLYYSNDYEALFGSDPELHADCMSIAVKPDFQTPYGSVCTPEMVESAGNVWDGVFN